VIVRVRVLVEIFVFVVANATVSIPEDARNFAYFTSINGVSPIILLVYYPIVSVILSIHVHLLCQ
jgi:hypothetical protein